MEVKPDISVNLLLLENKESIIYNWLFLYILLSYNHMKCLKTPNLK